MQEQSQVLGLLELCAPKEVAQEALAAEQGRPPLRARAKVVECIAEMCRAQAHGFFRASIINSTTVFSKLLEFLFESLKLNDTPLCSLYFQLFLAVCLGPDSVSLKSAAAKGRRAVYIPGETQENRRLKRQAIQNGALLAAHQVQLLKPELRGQLQPLYYSLDDGDILLHLMCLIDFMCEEPASEDSGDAEKLKQHMVLHSYAKENVLPVSIFKSLKAEAERLLPPTNGHVSRFKHNFSQVLISEFLAVCSSQTPLENSSSFGITYLQEQLGLAVAITEKR